MAKANIPAATRTRQQPSQPTRSITISGSDNLTVVSMSNSSNHPLGSNVFHGTLTAGSTKRLEQLAKSYQRVKWNKIAFTIEGAFPTTAGGGYVAAFIRDPTDTKPLDPHDAIQWAMAQQHSRDAKWYDSVRLDVRATPDLLFTSHGSDRRFYSPGSIYVISKGGPAQVGALTINLQWTVTLSEPSVENAGGVTETLPPGLYFPFNNSKVTPVIGVAQLCWITDFPVATPNTTTYDLAKAGDVLDGTYRDGTYFRVRGDHHPQGFVKHQATDELGEVRYSGFTLFTNNGVQGLVPVVEIDVPRVSSGPTKIYWIPSMGAGFQLAGYNVSGNMSDVNYGFTTQFPLGAVFDVFPSPPDKGSEVSSLPPLLSPRKAGLTNAASLVPASEVAQVSLSGEV